VFRRVQQGSASLIISTVIEAELLVRPGRNEDVEAKQRIADLLSEDGIYVVGVDRRIARRAAALRARVAKPRSVGLPDAIIVATAIETGCDAIVGNDKDWRGWTMEVPYVHLDDAINTH
jgi:predicted nucleic acid-binding protein